MSAEKSIERPSVLIVDDERNLLSALKRTLRNAYDLHLAESGDEALRIIQTHGQIRVIVCDMNMPGKSGIETLAKVSNIAPDTVRIMLTGQADAQTAMRAVNEGSIFRFLSKPCASDALAIAIDAGLEQYKLITAERELLEKTLSGSIKVLTDILAIHDPQSFARLSEIRAVSQSVAAVMDDRKAAWKIEMSMLLAPIGRAALPPQIGKKLHIGETLSDAELAVYHASAEVSHKLIRNIPRLDEIAEAVRFQFKNMDGSGSPSGGPKGKDIPTLGRIIRILNAAFDLQNTIPDFQDAMVSLRSQTGVLDADLLETLAPAILKIFLTQGKGQSEDISVDPTSLLSGDFLLSPIMDQDTGEILLTVGSQINDVLIDRILNLMKIRTLNKTISVQRKCLIQKDKPAAAA